MAHKQNNLLCLHGNNYAEYENNIYKKHEELAEREIITNLNNHL